MQGFPITQKNDDFALRLMREGMPLFGVYGNITGAYAPNQSIMGASSAAGQMWYIASITVSANQACNMVVQLGNGAITPSNIINPYTGVVFGDSTGGQVTIPMGILVPERTAVIVTMGSTAGGDTNFRASAGVMGYRVSMDFAYEAEKTLLVLGDSISNGTGVNYSDELYYVQLRDALIRATGKRWRVVVKGNGSYTTSHMDALRAEGWLNVADADLIIYHLGMNNSSAATYQTDLQNLIDKWKRTRFPSTPMVVCGPTLRTDAQETVLAAIRTNAQTVVNTIGNQTTTFGGATVNMKLSYCNFGDLWQSADQNSKTITETPRVHPNASGHTDMYNRLWTHIQTAYGVNTL